MKIAVLVAAAFTAGWCAAAALMAAGAWHLLREADR
jgi:hypothetical protein